MFLVVLRQAGPQWDSSRPLEEQSKWREHAAYMDGLVDSGAVVLGGPVAEGNRVVLAMDAQSEDALRATLALDPWHASHLLIDTVERWDIRLDGRSP
jgi:hypothetical protein